MSDETGTPPGPAPDAEGPGPEPVAADITASSPDPAPVAEPAPAPPPASGTVPPSASGGSRRKLSKKAIALRVVIGLVALFGLIQLIPYGRDHTNPPATAEPNWDSPQTRALAVKACYDCHSNETKWPWYTNVAPVSWLVQKDVDEGRGIINFSEWNAQRGETDDIVGVVREGEMPPFQYTLIHGSLSDSEKQALADGLQKTLARPGTTPPPKGS